MTQKMKKTPLQRAKRTKKLKEITIIVPPTDEHNIDTEAVEMIPSIPALQRSKSIKPEIKEELKPEIKEELTPIKEEELTPEIKEELTPEIKEELTPEIKEELILIVPEKRREYKAKSKRQHLF